MKNTYLRTKWVDGHTPVNSANLNKIENAIYDIYSNTPSKSQIIGKDTNIVETGIDEKGNVVIDIPQRRNGCLGVQKSLTCSGLEFTQDEAIAKTAKDDKVYLVLDIDTMQLRRIYINGVKIYEME